MTLDYLTLAPAAEGEDSVKQYLHEIRSYPRLTAEEELELAQRCAQGDEDAIRKMVNCNLRLVVSMARGYAGRGIPLMDLVQEGSIGLLIAAKKFDYSRDLRFSTYATKWIHQGISKCFASSGTIRVPAHTAEKIRKVLSARAELTKKLEMEPTDAELAEYCQLPIQRVQQLLSMNPDVCSLDTPVGEDEGSLGQFVEDKLEPQPYEKVVREELTQTVKTLLSTLNERQQQVLRMRYGFADGKCYSFAEIGKMIGVSKERVRQIERQAMDKLHARGMDIGLEDYLE